MRLDSESEVTPLTVDLNWSVLFSAFPPTHALQYERGAYSIELTAGSNGPGNVGSRHYGGASTTPSLSAYKYK